MGESQLYTLDVSSVDKTVCEIPLSDLLESFGIKMATFGTFICEIFGDMICFPYFPEKSNWTMEGIVLQLRQIIRHYILHGSYFADCGPLNDKMGFVLFFFHYIRYASDSKRDEPKKLSCKYGLKTLVS